MAQEIADSKLIDTWSSDGLKVKPDISKIIEGWQLGEQPPHEYMNWLQNIFGSKLNHILKNGVASWNNETEYLAGSSVQHNGNVWLCKTTNTNSTPTDANANWKRIITVESLTTLLTGYVATTGNQTIAGVKTFSSPIVATTSTNDYQGAGLTTSGNGAANTIFPSIGFHQPTLHAGRIALTGNGIFSFFKTDNIAKATIVADLSGNAESVTNGVYTTGNQTINGVKTFSSSPIVPTPTTGDNSTKVATTAFVNAKSELDSIGVGQTYQNVSGSRNINQDYTNTSGKPILLVVTIICSGSSSLTITVGGVLMNFTGSTYAGDYMSASIIVPNGAVYRFASTGNNITSKTVWELR